MAFTKIDITDKSLQHTQHSLTTKCNVVWQRARVRNTESILCDKCCYSLPFNINLEQPRRTVNVFLRCEACLREKGIYSISITFCKELIQFVIRAAIP